MLSVLTSHKEVLRVLSLPLGRRGKSGRGTRRHSGETQAPVTASIVLLACFWVCAAHWCCPLPPGQSPPRLHVTASCYSCAWQISGETRRREEQGRGRAVILRGHLSPWTAQCTWPFREQPWPRVYLPPARSWQCPQPSSPAASGVFPGCDSCVDEADDFLGRLPLAAGRSSSD